MRLFEHKDLLSIDQLSIADIKLILDMAESFKEISSRDIKKVPTLRGKTVVNLFYEPSTRTRSSFEIAAKRLSADTFNLSSSNSSTIKGETLIDTGRNLQAMNPDVIILRHSSTGAPHMMAKAVNYGVINAGDGINEHPTQALLDLFTIREKKGRVEGLKIVIIGDISHSRVAKSNIKGLKKLGADVTVSGPPTMVPVGIENYGINVIHNPSEAIRNKDVIMLLRIQFERQSNVLFPSIREYAKYFGVTRKMIELANDDAIIMHPGPINRGVELASELIDAPDSVILEQVKNGVAIRMAILYLLIGGSSK